MAAAAASPLAVLRPGSLTAYWRFQRGVAKAQLAAWLPAKRRLLIDISGPSANCAAQAAARGHTVVRVIFGTRTEGSGARTALSASSPGRDTAARRVPGDAAGDATGTHRRPPLAG